MTIPWQPIIVSTVRVIGRHPRYARLIVVRFELDRRPPTRWVELFARVDPALETDTAALRLLDGLVQVDARDDALDEDLAGVLLHIEATNHWYHEEMLGSPQPLPSQTSATDDDRLHNARARVARLTREFARLRLTDTGAWRDESGVFPGPPGERDL